MKRDMDGLWERKFVVVFEKRVEDERVVVS